MHARLIVEFRLIDTPHYSAGSCHQLYAVELNKSSHTLYCRLLVSQLGLSCWILVVVCISFIHNLSSI